MSDFEKGETKSAQQSIFKLIFLQICVPSWQRTKKKKDGILNNTWQA